MSGEWRVVRERVRLRVRVRVRVKVRATVRIRVRVRVRVGFRVRARVRARVGVKDRVSTHRRDALQRGRGRERRRLLRRHVTFRAVPVGRRGGVRAQQCGRRRRRVAAAAMQHREAQ